MFRLSDNTFWQFFILTISLTLDNKSNFSWATVPNTLIIGNYTTKCIFPTLSELQASTRKTQVAWKFDQTSTNFHKLLKFSRYRIFQPKKPPWKLNSYHIIINSEATNGNIHPILSSQKFEFENFHQYWSHFTLRDSLLLQKPPWNSFLDHITTIFHVIPRNSTYIKRSENAPCLECDFGPYCPLFRRDHKLKLPALIASHSYQYNLQWHRFVLCNYCPNQSFHGFLYESLLPDISLYLQLTRQEYHLKPTVTHESHTNSSIIPRHRLVLWNYCLTKYHYRVTFVFPLLLHSRTWMCHRLLVPVCFHHDTYQQQLPQYLHLSYNLADVPPDNAHLRHLSPPPTITNHTMTNNEFTVMLLLSLLLVLSFFFSIAVYCLIYNICIPYTCTPVCHYHSHTITDRLQLACARTVRLIITRYPSNPFLSLCSQWGQEDTNFTTNRTTYFPTLVTGTPGVNRRPHPHSTKGAPLLTPGSVWQPIQLGGVQQWPSGAILGSLSLAKTGPSLVYQPLHSGETQYPQLPGAVSGYAPLAMTGYGLVYQLQCCRVAQRNLLILDLLLTAFEVVPCDASDCNVPSKVAPDAIDCNVSSMDNRKAKRRHPSTANKKRRKRAALIRTMLCHAARDASRAPSSVLCRQLCLTSPVHECDNGVTDTCPEAVRTRCPPTMRVSETLSRLDKNGSPASLGQIYGTLSGGAPPIAIDASYPASDGPPRPSTRRSKWGIVPGPDYNTENLYPAFVSMARRVAAHDPQHPHARPFLSKAEWDDLTIDDMRREFAALGIVDMNLDETTACMFPAASDIARQYTETHMPNITGTTLTLDEVLSHVRIVHKRVTQFQKRRKRLRSQLARAYKRQADVCPAEHEKIRSDLHLQLHQTRQLLAQHNNRLVLLRAKAKADVARTVKSMPKTFFVPVNVHALPTYNRFAILSEHDVDHPRVKSWYDFLPRLDPHTTSTAVDRIVKHTPKVQTTPASPLQAYAQLRKDAAVANSLPHLAPDAVYDVRGWNISEDAVKDISCTVGTWNVNALDVFTADVITVIMTQGNIDVMVCTDTRHSKNMAKSLKRRFVHRLGAGTKVYCSVDSRRKPGEPGGIVVIIGPKWGPSYLHNDSRTDDSGHGILASVRLRTTSGIISVAGTYWPSTTDDPKTADTGRSKLWNRVSEYRKGQQAHDPNPISYVKQLLLTWRLHDITHGSTCYIIAGDLNSTWLSSDPGGQRAIRQWATNNDLSNGPRMVHDAYAPPTVAGSGIAHHFITYGCTTWTKSSWIDHVLHSGSPDHVSVLGACNALGPDIECCLTWWIVSEFRA